MQAEEFVTVLAKNSDRLGGIISHVPKRRSSALLYEGVKDEAIRFLSVFETARLRIGMLTFLPQPKPHPSGAYVAELEADPLLVRADGGEVVLLDYADTRFEMAKVAVSGSRLFDGLAHVIGRRERTAGQHPSLAREAALLSGCESAEAFFRQLD